MTIQTDPALAPTASYVRLPSPADLPVVPVDTNALRKKRIVGFSSRDIRARSFNLLRSQVLKQLDESGGRLLGFTSAAPAAGKSFVSLNLAAALAQTRDRPIYLFDFDLRRGSIARALDQDGVGVGIGAYLSGETDDLRAIGRRVGEDGFIFFPAFADAKVGVDLFTSARFEALIAAMRRLPKEAVVLCDLPPAFANDDAATITAQLDGFLMVVEQGETTQKQVTGALDLLSPARCLGTVLNRYDGGWTDPYGYGYGDKYATYYG